MSDDDKALLTDADIAERIGGMTVEDVRRRCRRGDFSHVRIGRKYRFTEADYEAIVATHRREAKVTATTERPFGIVTRGKAS